MSSIPVPPAGVFFRTCDDDNIYNNDNDDDNDNNDDIGDHLSLNLLIPLATHL
jgi:hypothetical protein